MERFRGRLAEIFELSTRGRITAMEGMRGLACLMIFYVHYYSVLSTWTEGSNFHRLLEMACTPGVDLFFVISGYMIYGAVLRSKSFSYRDFMHRRLRRIYPPFLVMLAVYLVAAAVAPGDTKFPPDRPHQLLYVVENLLFLPGVFDIRPLMTVAWTLSYEVLFYAVIPLLVALGMRSWTARARILTFLALSLAFAVCSFFGAGHVKFLMFASGIVVYEAMKVARPQPTAAFQRAAMVLAALAIPVAVFLGELHAVFPLRGAMIFGDTPTSFIYLVRTLWLCVAFGVFTAAAFRGSGTLSKVCSVAPLRWFGNMSYSYYLVHGFVLKVFGVLAARVVPASLQTPVLFWVLAPLMFVVTVVVSAAMFIAIEKPFSLGGKPFSPGATSPQVQRAPQPAIGLAA